MKIVHVSDTHGTFPKLPKEGEVVFHSGDFFPNFSPFGMGRDVEAQRQGDWMRRKAYTISHWIGDRPLIVCPGNHDFAAPHLAAVGMMSIADRTTEVPGLGKVYGLPWIPYMGGFWNWEAEPQSLFMATHAIPDDTEILLCHAPPLGFLDNCPGGHIGNPFLMPKLLGMLKPPKTVLCGHVHEEGGGQTEYSGIRIYNGATKVRVIDV